MRRMPHTIAERIIVRIGKIAKGETEGMDIKAMQGTSAYRLRVGRYRVIYKLVNGQFTVLVLRVGPRGDVYK